MNDTPHARAQRVLDEARQRWSDQPLRAIFSCIGEQAPQVWYRPQRFSLDWDTLKPIAEQAAATQSNTELRLRHAFQQAYAALPALSSAQSAAEQALWIDQALALFQDYAWAAGYEPLAADPQPRDDAVSLYDYARTEAARAAAGPDALLLGGDISGIQAFIYTIAASKAAKSLRARSFYLQLLTDAIAEWLLTKSGMPRTNLLYAGGGRFYVIVPAACASQLPEWRKTLGELLLHAHSGELYVALGAASISDGFSAVFGEVNRAVSDDKRHRFATLDTQTVYKQLFTPRGHEGNADDRCVVCGWMGAPDNFVAVPKDDRDENDPTEKQQRCRLCASLIELGRDLPRVQWIIRRPQQDIPQPHSQRMTWQEVLKQLGMDVNTDSNKIPSTPAPGTQLQLIESLKPLEDIDAARQALPHTSVEFRPMVNITPHDGQGIKEFGQLTRESQGIDRLGVLRMDIDDLGDIFAFHLKGTTLARISTLSAALSRFFEGWVGEICRGATPFKQAVESNPQLQAVWQLWQQSRATNQVYSVYSGGDDVFLVGSWTAMPAVAMAIQTMLRQYTGGNPNVHISGGLTLHSEKYPLYQAAKDAHEALDAAKDVQRNNGNHVKDAFNFLGQTVGWEWFGPAQQTSAPDPTPTAMALFMALHDHTSASGAAKSLLNTLRELYDQSWINMDHKPGGRAGKRQLTFGPWVWRGAYQLKRIAERVEKEGRQPAFIDQLRTNLVKGIDERPEIGAWAIERYGLAARWVQLFIRSTTKDQGDRA